MGQTSKAVFLEAGEEIIWIAGPTGVRHRRAVVATDVPRWSVGTEIGVCKGTLRGDPELRLAGAFLWRAPPLPRPGHALGRGAKALLEAFSWSRLDPWGRWTSSLREACGRDGPRGVIEWGRGLVGRGPGLTPVGDDLLGGALFGLRVIGLSDLKWEDFLIWACGQTSRLSWCLLVDLACGHGPEPLHQLAAALARGWPRVAELAVFKLEQIGQSTGRALLLGALGVWATLEN